MEYNRSEKYCTPELMAKMMGPNPIKLEEELLQNSGITPDMTVCDMACVSKGPIFTTHIKRHVLRALVTKLNAV